MIFPQTVFSVCFQWLFIIGVIITLAMLWSVLIVGIVIDFGAATLPNLGNLIPDIPVPSIPNPVNVIFQNKCIEALGCFYTGPPFYDILNRPISLAPTDNLQTKFLLFTPKHPEEEILELTEESVRNSSFNASLQLKVLIHGFRADLDVDDIRFKMKDAFLNLSDYNIIVVDWTENNGSPYAQAFANARAVGAQLAVLLKIIIDLGYRPENIHLIGHSLGGHISGWAGERIPNLGRITGLDPAGPYFQDNEKVVRLDATDAQFVDVIHTDGGENVFTGLGIGDPVGHIDFYPNGGRFQPGCATTSASTSVVGSIINSTTSWVSGGCDHSRASKLFLESIDSSKCRFLAVWCNSYEDFERGECLPPSSTLSEMGFYAKKIQGLPVKSKFFLRTNASWPFCIEDSIYL